MCLFLFPFPLNQIIHFLCECLISALSLLFNDLLRPDVNLRLASCLHLTQSLYLFHLHDPALLVLDHLLKAQVQRLLFELATPLVDLRPSLYFSHLKLQLLRSHNIVVVLPHVCVCVQSVREPFNLSLAGFFSSVARRLLTSGLMHESIEVLSCVVVKLLDAGVLNNEAGADVLHVVLGCQHEPVAKHTLHCLFQVLICLGGIAIV